MIDLILMAPQTTGASNPIMSFLPIVLIGVVFYFFMIRPQTQRAKEQKLFIEGIKKGDKIVTNSGIHGKIVELGTDFFLVEVDNNVRIKFDRAALSPEATKAANKAVV